MVGDFHYDRVRYTENPKTVSDVSCCRLSTGFLLISHLNREDGNRNFLRNVCVLILDYTAPHSAYKIYIYIYI